MWPNYVGAEGNEDVRCFVYDPKSKLFIVGGKTSGKTSFVPTDDSEDYGYLFALDKNGDWQWGNYFLNDTKAISSIDGCQFSSSGDALAITGLADGKPFVMDVKPSDGTIVAFFHIETNATAS